MSVMLVPPRLAPGRRPRRIVVAVLLLLAGLGAQPAGADVARFRIDPEDSALTFKATSRLVNADGRFHRFAGDVLVDPRDPTTARINLTVEAASIDTANGKRDNHLRSQDFFWAERHPTITFESRRVGADGAGVTVVGRLTIRGVTREVTAPTTVEVTAERLVARGQFDLKRSDYDMTYQSLLNPVGDVVHVAFVFRGRRVTP
jgi:polyisoprenoid-binding protein YceI